MILWRNSSFYTIQYPLEHIAVQCVHLPCVPYLETCWSKWARPECQLQHEVSSWISAAVSCISKKKQCLLEWSFQFSSIFLLEQALTMRFVLLPNNSETRIQNSLGVYVDRINREDKESRSRSIDAYCWKDPAEVLLECYDDVSWTLEGFQEYRYAGEISYVILYFRLILWFIEAAGMWLNRCMSGLPCEASSLLQTEADKKLEMDGTGENMEIIKINNFF